MFGVWSMQMFSSYCFIAKNTSSLPHIAGGVMNVGDETAEKEESEAGIEKEIGGFGFKSPFNLSNP